MKYIEKLLVIVAVIALLGLGAEEAPGEELSFTYVVWIKAIWLAVFALALGAIKWINESTR